MNQTMKDFLEKNGIDAENIPDGMKLRLTNPDNFNKYLTYFSVQKDKEKRNVCITDIIGSDAFVKNGNIYDLMAIFFDVKGDPYHRRSTDLLEIPSADIMEELKVSFSDDPIILADYEGKYFVRTNGNHRVFAMYLNYLLESQNANTPEEKEALKKKYTFPAYVMEIETDKSYANFMLQSKRSRKYIDRVFDMEKMRVTDDYELVEYGERRTIKNDGEIDEFVRENFVELLKNGDTYIVEELLNAAKEHESFRKYFSSIFPEISEQEVMATLDKLNRGLYLAQPDLSKVEDLSDVLELVNANEDTLKKLKSQFSGFSKVAGSTDKQLDEYFSIMGIDQEKTASMDELTTRFNSIVSKAESMLDEAYKTRSRALYTRAQNAIQALSGVNLSIFSRTYQSKGIVELKDKISQIAVRLQSEGQISEIDTKRKEESEKRFGLLDRLRGKQRLRDATVRNLELQRQYIQKIMDTPKPMEDAVRELYNYMKVHGVTKETKDFMTRLRKLDKVADFVHLNKLCIEAFLPVKRHEPKLSARKQAAKVEEENRGIEEKIQTGERTKFSSKVKVQDTSRTSGMLNAIANAITLAENAVTLDKARGSGRRHENVLVNE